MRKIAFACVATATATFFVLIAGAMSTQRRVDDGLRDLPEALRGFAADSLENARMGCFDNPIQRVWPHKLRVERISDAAGCALEPSAKSPHIATIRVYGPFARPKNAITVACGVHTDCGLLAR